MKGRKKPIVRADAVHHVYQNTRKGYLIFYSVKDYLILFSVITVVACRYGIKILGISMIDAQMKQQEEEKKKED